MAVISQQPGVDVVLSSSTPEVCTVVDGAVVAVAAGDCTVTASQAGDTTWLPANLSHRFRNLSDTAPMKILWIYANAQATRTLTESGETRYVYAEHKA